MHAIYFNSYGGPEVLQFGNLPDPVPVPGQILIQVKAVSINPKDYKLLQGQKRIAGSRFPQIPCSDFAGIVKESGDCETGFNPCDKVYGFISPIHRKQGSLAELVSVSPHQVRALPEGMAFEEAASLPVASLTALNGLRQAGDLKGKSVLINGATGGVGHFAIQLARNKGARVTGICSTHNKDLAVKFGADEVIDYTKTDLSSCEKKFDLILDAYGRMKKADIFRLLNKKGVYASTQFGPETHFSTLLTQLISGKKLTSSNMRAANEDFEEIEDLFRKGKINPYVEHTFNLENAADAFRLAVSGKPRGKIVVRI